MKVIHCILLLALCAFAQVKDARAQLSWREITSLGDTNWYSFPPPDSVYYHDELFVKLKKEALDYDSLCYDCTQIVQMKAGGKVKEKMSADLFAVCKEVIMDQRFSLNVITDTVLRQTLAAYGATTLRRVSAANPCVDTISVSRLGDTVAMDHYTLMIVKLNNDSSLIPLLTNLFILNPSGLEIAEPNYKLDLHRTPVDPEFASGRQASFQMIGMEDAWDHQFGFPNIRVSVVDNGLDYRRCEFWGFIGGGWKVAGGWDYNSNTMDNVFNQSDHGTPVASIIGAFTNNLSCGAPAPLGVAGIAGGWGPANNSPDLSTGATLFGYRVSKDNDNIHIVEDWAVSAILESVAESPVSHYGAGAHIVNLSWGGHTPYSWKQRYAINQAYWNASQVVASKGNSASGLSNRPSDYDPERNIIAVSASDFAKDRIFYSNFNNATDLMAPGGLINDPTNQIVRTVEYNTDATFQWFQGTSAAAPHVSGVAALVLNQLGNTERQFEDLQGIITAGTEDRGDPLYDEETGWGFLRADNIFEMLDPHGDLAYELRHFVAKGKDISFGPWSDPFSLLIFTSDKNHNVTQNMYVAKRREMTATISYEPANFNTNKQVFAWGNSASTGYPNSDPFWFEPWGEVTSGAGGNGLRPGIKHDHSTDVDVRSYQYDIWTLDGSTYKGRYPADADAAIGLTVYGATKHPSAVKAEATSEGSQTAPILIHRGSRMDLGSLPEKITEVYDILGRAVLRTDADQTVSRTQLMTLPSGVYFCVSDADRSDMIKIIIE
jgi:subtilisin family serine protease